MSNVIIGALDDSSQHDAVGRVAFELAEGLALEPVFARVIDDSSGSPPSAGAAREGARHQRIEGARHEGHGVVHTVGEGRDVQADACLGDPAGAILAAAAQHDATYVVVGSRGSGAIRSLFSPSVSQQVLERSAQRVVVVPSRIAAAGEPHVISGESIICGVDGTAAGQHATDAAKELARALGLRLVLVHAHIAAGPPHEVLARLAAEENAALIVIGRGDDDGRSGSGTARRLVRRVSVPVVSVPVSEAPA
jgi:nucleotide-binding universal stress UspA family protein